MSSRLKRLLRIGGGGGDCHHDEEEDVSETSGLHPYSNGTGSGSGTGAGQLLYHHNNNNNNNKILDSESNYNDFDDRTRRKARRNNRDAASSSLSSSSSSSSSRLNSNSSSPRRSQYHHASHHGKSSPRQDPLLIRPSPKSKKKKKKRKTKSSSTTSSMNISRQTLCFFAGCFVLISTQVWIHRRNIQAWEEYWMQSVLLASSSYNMNGTTIAGAGGVKQLESFLSQHLQSFRISAHDEDGAAGADDLEAQLLLKDWDWDAVAQHGHVTEGALLPTWMKEYFQWHQATLQKLNEQPETWDQYHYLIVRCLAMDGDRCGDLSHRLQSLPIALSMANQSQRLLFIRWEQPAALENFLVPPILSRPQHVGIDWRLPNWLHEILQPRYGGVRTIVGNSLYSLQEVQAKNATIIMMRHLTRDHGSHLYNDLRQMQVVESGGTGSSEKRVISKEPSFELVFRHVWHAFFQPSPAVQELYNRNVQALQLIDESSSSSTATNDNRNNTTHVQLQPFLLLHIPDLQEDKADIRKAIIEGAVSCVQNVLKTANEERTKEGNNNPLNQVVVTSQSLDMIQTALAAYPESENMIALKTREDLLELDYGRDALWRLPNRTATYYYQVFAYIHLWTQLECIVYGKEGDGDHWKFLLGRNPRCAAQYKRRKRNFCKPVKPQQLVPPLPKEEVAQALQATKSVGAVAFAQEILPAVVGSVTNAGQNQNQQQQNRAAIAAIASAAGDSYVPEPKFPEWMNEYFAWHGEERKRLTQKNWRSYKYLVMRCLAIDEKCGGAADRLQSVPLAILFASLSGRFLLIHWERPCSLQEFFVPPKGGLDWRMPSWLHEKLDYEHSRVIVLQAFKPVTTNRPLVTMRHQKFWPEFYNERKQAHERSYEDVFHAVFTRVFEPTLPIQALIEKHMREMNLVKDKYVAVHIRSKYHYDLTRDTAAVHNAMNCASTLRPGWPIYVASDSTKVIRMAMEYGKSKGVSVAARTDEHEPLHLDRGAAFLSHRNRNSKWQDHSASHYYDVFIDLYLLGDSECLTHGYGGYGRLGSLLSYNQTCSINHMEQNCTWNGVADAGAPVAIV